MNSPVRMISTREVRTLISPGAVLRTTFRMCVDTVA
jgi:hypothetical protein